MDNFNNENNGMPEELPNPTPAADLDGDEATNEQPAIPGEPEVKSGFTLAQDANTGENPQFGQPMGGMNQQPQGQPMFGQQMGGMNQQPQGQPMFGQPMGGANPQFGQPQGGMNPQFGQPQGGMNPQFGQPMGGMNSPYGQPGMPPQGGQPPKAKKPKKPLSKGAIGGIIGGGVALIALIVCAIIFLPKLFPTDKEVVIDAFEATFGVETDAEKEDVVGADEIYDKFATTGGKREAYFEISEDLDGEVMSIGVGTLESIDVQSKLANTSITMDVNGTDVLSANMVVDENNTYFQIPEMINGYFSLPNENILQQLENSELGQLMEISGMPEINMADLYFNLATTGSATELNSDYVAIAERLWDSITYEKQGKAKVDVNGKTVTTKEYFITVPKDSVKDAISDFWDAAVAELAANEEYLAEMGMDASTFESTMNSYKSMLTGLVQDDLVIKVYIADDEIVKIVCADELTIYGAEIEYDIYMDIDDEKASGVIDFAVMGESVGLKFDADNIDENPTGKITLYAASEIIDVNFKITDNSTDSKESCNVYCDVVYNGTTYVTADVTANVDEKNNTFDGNAKIDVMDEGEIEFTFDGGLKDINKGVAYTVELSSCELFVEGTSVLNMTGYVKVDTSEHTASGIDTSIPVYDVTTMSETDLEDVLYSEENQSLMESWMENYYAALGIDYTYEEPEVEEPVVEEPEDSDMILDGFNMDVEILGTIDGFVCDMTSDDYIYFQTEEWSYLEYTLYEDITPAEIVEFIYVPTEDVITQEIGQTMDLDGETIYYSYVQDNEFGYLYSGYMFAKDLGDGTVLVVSAGIYDEDDSYTKEQLAQALSTQYYKIIK